MKDRRDLDRELDEASIRSALDRILNSDVFARSPKVSSLLAYLVDRRLAGDEEGLKEARIAQGVFGHPAEFNPRANPIVRVNASRLRNLLRTYYAGPGKDDRLRVVLPDIGYRPDFPGTPVRRENRAARAADEANAPRRAAATACAAAIGDDVRSGEVQEGEGRAQNASAAVPDRAEAERAATPPNDTPAGDAKGADGSWRSRIGQQGVMALVITNLLLAGTFAILAGRTYATDVRHVLSLSRATAGTTAQVPLFMLCDRPGSDGDEGGGAGGADDAYPVAIDGHSFLCWPVQLHRADLSGNPI